MVPPTIATPATILSFFIIFLLKNFASSGGVSVGDEELEGEGCDPSNVKCCDGANPSGIEWCESTPDIGSSGCIDIASCEGTDPTDAGDIVRRQRPA
ncbi:hypothetical protein F5888DRAFT_1739706 [Russula emetica]|nr:hypothetical protein F5888DRAFT_1739706 [Russula emetica]